MKEIKEDTNRWRNTPCSWIGRINIVKMSILPKETLPEGKVTTKLDSILKSRDIKETIPFTIATKRIKYLGIYLPKKLKTYI